MKMKMFSLPSAALLFCIAVLATGPAIAVEKREVDALEALTAMVVENVPTLAEQSVAVFPFSYPDGIKSMEGAMISERLITKLTMSAKVKVLERRLLEEALAELKLSASGLVDPGLAVKMGKMIGAHGIVSGTITDLGEKVEINARLIKVETGEVIASKSLRTRKLIKTFISPFWDEIDRIKQERPSFKARMWMDKDAYKIGDFFSVHFKVARDCYVTIFDFTTDGSIFILFPNKFAPNNRVKGGRIYTIPAEDGGYKIRVHGPAGLERLKLFATTKDIPLFDEDYSQSPFRSISGSGRRTSRNLQITIDNLGKNRWAESHGEFLIENILRGDAALQKKEAEPKEEDIFLASAVVLRFDLSTLRGESIMRPRVGISETEEGRLTVGKQSFKAAMRKVKNGLIELETTVSMKGDDVEEFSLRHRSVVKLGEVRTHSELLTRDGKRFLYVVMVTVESSDVLPEDGPIGIHTEGMGDKRGR